ncbi:MAG: HEAT repeat domain-containing protein [Acidobacteriota bacterium]
MKPSLIAARWPPRRLRRGWGLALGLCLLGAIAGTRAELIRLTLYEKPAESELVVRGRVKRGDLRLAEIAVEQVLKGSYDRPSLWIVFRLDNFTRRAWQQKVTFYNGEPVLLFLKPFEKSTGEQPFPDRFTLVRGVQGKVELPPEGGEAIVEATRRFVRVQAQVEIEQTTQDLLSFLSDPNPLIKEAGLQQATRLRLGHPEMVGALLPILDHPVPDFRREALLLLSQIFEDRNYWREPLVNEDHVVSLVLTRAREDEDTEVRAEAVRTLAARGKTDILPALRQIAGSDPTQRVRFQAGVAAYDLSQQQQPRPPNSR